MLKRRIISLLLTLFLGPGIGHLYLRSFLKAAVMVGINLSLAVILVLQMDKSILSSANSMVIAEFLVKNRGRLLYHDLITAGIWAFALIDVWNLTRPEKHDQNIHA